MAIAVKQAIELLSKIPDKEILLMIDCPHCGKANELGSVKECVVLGKAASPSPLPIGEKK